MTNQDITEQIKALEEQIETWPAWKKIFFDYMAQGEEHNDKG